MRTIPLSKGKETIVDDDVYEALMQHGWKWFCSNSGYAVTNIRYRSDTKKTTTTILLHRWVYESFYNLPLGGLLIDHVNGDGLDNQLSNLRAATYNQNVWNRRTFKNNTSTYRGVCFVKAIGKYIASVDAKGKSFFLGHFADPLEAAKAYDSAARQLHGKFANTNFK